MSENKATTYNGNDNKLLHKKVPNCTYIYIKLALLSKY